MHVTRQIGRYEIDREIGRGGTAIVYLARQVDLGREVALKELSAFHAGDRLFAERFLREARLGGSLNHPNIVTVYDYFEHDAVPYIAMEHVARGSLRAYAAPLSTAQSLGVLEGMLAGLTHAEARSIVHRDLKPENLMVADDGTIKIADFGIAKALSGSVSINLTETGTTVGTPHYMAPEQAMGEPIGPGTDLYATGAIAYELFTGRPPFGSSATPMAVLLRHVSEQAEPPIVHDPALDPRISDWIMRMLAKRPEDRPAGAEVAWEELEDIALDLLGPRWRRNARLLGDTAGKGSASPTASVVPVPVAPTITARTPPTLTSSTPPSTPPPSQPPPSRPPAEPSDRRRWLGVGAALILLVTAAVAAFLVVGRDDSTGSGGGSAPTSTLTPTTTVAVKAGAEHDAGVFRSVLQGDGADVWLLRRGHGSAGSTITSVAPEDGTLGTEHPIPRSLIGMGIGPTSLWMLGMKTEKSINSVLAEVDPDTGSTIREIPLPGLPACLEPPVGRCNPVVGAGSVWAPMGGEIVRQSLVGAAKLVHFPLEGRLWDLSYGNDATWVLSGGSLIRLDPNGAPRKSFNLAGRLPDGIQPINLIATDDAIWVVARSLDADDPVPGTLMQIDPESGTIQRSFELPGISGIQIADGALWVAREGQLGRAPNTVEVRSLTTGLPIGKPTAIPQAAKWLAPVPDGVIALMYDKLTQQRTLVKLTASM
ncbi:MAG: protein kinase [Gaiellales bacterium]